MSTDSGFGGATTLHDEGGGTYRTAIAEGWDIAGNANGGYLLSLVTKAVSQATGKPHPVTVTGHYLAPGRPGEAEVVVDVRRTGGRHATSVATLRSAGQELVVALVTATDLFAASGPERLDAPPPPLPDPEDCLPVEATNSFPPPFAGKVETRLHPDDAGFREGRPSGKALVRGWFRLPHREPMDAHALVVAVDAFPPTIFNADLPVAWTPTVELTAHVRRLPPSDGQGWLRCAFSTRFITGGYLEADGEVWDQEGRLIAESRQLALVPRAPSP